MDGVGMNYENSSRSDKLNSDSIMDYYWAHYQGFISAALLWNPRSDMLLKSTVGTGYEKTVMDGDTRYNILNKKLTDDFTAAWYYPMLSARVDDPYDFRTTLQVKQTDLVVNAQGRLDYDWDAGKGFLLASGVQEMFTRYETRGNQMTNMEKNLRDFTDAEQIEILKDMGFEPAFVSEELQRILIVSIPFNNNPNAQNNLFTTSGYGLAEYHTPSNRIKAELGLRLDHYHLIGDGFSVQSKPAQNPRLNADFNVFKNIGYVQSFDISAGTGLFSSMNNNVFTAVEKYNITGIKPNRSWTSVLGTKLELFDSIVFNIEGYYKYTFDRMYTTINIGLDGKPDVQPNFNGEGKVWGMDLMLQKTQSRYWDSWVSYSFNWAKYRDPDAGNADMGLSGGENGNDWYFPSYHRFHNFNLVLNIKPVSKINIYNRLGFASGVQINRRIGDRPTSYPVYVLEDKKIIELFYWPAVRDENNRTTPSVLWDIKISIFGSSRNRKVLYEVYNGIENVLGLLYSSQGNTSFNQYTGEVDAGSMFAAYEIPIPIPSFGVKISY
jgi:hypothetical protein